MVANEASLLEVEEDRILPAQEAQVNVPKRKKKKKVLDTNAAIDYSQEDDATVDDEFADGEKKIKIESAASNGAPEEIDARDAKAVTEAVSDDIGNQVDPSSLLHFFP